MKSFFNKIVLVGVIKHLGCVWLCFEN